MRSSRLAPFALSLVLAAAARTVAPAPAEGLVVGTGWLAQHLSDPDLVLLHVGDRAEYDARHIPGARFVATSDVSVSDRSGKGLILEMPASEDLRLRLEKLGISDASRIVVYCGNDWLSPTTRVLFTLEYAGLGRRTSLLDGGMEAWIREGRPVTGEVPKTGAGTLAPLAIRPIVVDAEYVRAHLRRPGVAVVDARTTAFYSGAEAGGTPDGPHCTGHIGGALSIPFHAAFDDSGRLRSPEELSALFSGAGVKPDDTVIAYCHIGQQATAVLFAARILGHRVLLYDGSFQDWSRRPGFPVENPAKKD